MIYMGSKGRHARHILPIMLKNRTEDQWFVEPFCGGCNVTDKVTGKRLAADLNKYLIGLWKALQEGWDPPSFVSRELYNETKKDKDAYPPELIGWVGFAWSFRGTFYGAYVGEGEHPNGGNYGERGMKNILAQRDKLVGVSFRHSDYKSLFIPPKSIIYCDPPYRDVSKYRGGDYLINHDDFWDWVRMRIDQGHEVFVSEYSAPDDFVSIWTRETKSTLAYNSITGSNNTVIHHEQLFVRKDKVDGFVV